MDLALDSALVLRGGCGPLDLRIRAEDDAIAAVAQSYLELYSRPWSARSRSVEVTIGRGECEVRPRGSFLSCAHMSADRSGDRYVADTQYGIGAVGEIGERSDRWLFAVPQSMEFGEPQIGDMEDLFSLVCTAAWRAEGWLPIHAGAVERNSVCAILCASSGGGKSTLTTALIRSGWRTLGDDKLLLRTDGPVPQLCALLQTFNLDPATRAWFDLGDIGSLPRYSAFTEKRRVTLDWIMPGAALGESTPTHVVCIQRNPAIRGMRAHTLPPDDIVPALLRQIVLPTDREIVQSIVKTVAVCARTLRGGIRLEVGNDAYSEPDWLDAIEGVLR